MQRFLRSSSLLLRPSPLLLPRQFSSPAKATKPVMNRMIQHDPVRITYTADNGDKTNEVMTRKEALLFAKNLQLDLILIREDSDPPVCKVADYNLLQKKKVEKAKEVKSKQKEIREIHIGANIDVHDLGVKLEKVKEFLASGNEVKITINSNKKLMAKSPDAMDRTVLALLERVEGMVSTIRQPAVKFAEFRKDFILSPKPEDVAKPS